MKTFKEIILEEKIELKRTPEKDKKEKEIIVKNKKLYKDGKELENSFFHNNVYIMNPYKEPTNRYDVDPVERYGKDYIKWYNSL